MTTATKPFRGVTLAWPPTPRQWQGLSDALNDIYRWLNQSLVDTGAVAGGYGDVSHTPSLTVDATGRVSHISEVAIALDASAVTSGTLGPARMPALTGDVTTSAGTVATTLAASGVTAATYGDATHVAQVTVDAKGRITSASNVAITGGSAGLVLLEQHTASGSATLDFTAAISSTYDSYVIDIQGLIPATNNTDLWMRVSTDGGSTFASTTYAWQRAADFFGDTTMSGAGSTSDSKFLIFPGLDSSISDASLDATLWLKHPGNATLGTVYHGQLTSWYQPASPRLYMATVAGKWRTATAVNALRFLMSSGNIASGTIRIYGIVKT